MKVDSILFFLLFISYFVVVSHGSQTDVLNRFKKRMSYVRQTDALNRLFKDRLQRKARLNTYLDQKIELIDEARILSQKGLKEIDKISKLPGQPHVGFTQYGGYITVDEKAGRALFYYFTEAEHHKVSKPLLLWFNGGPGCSSIGYGAMEELGPFRVYSDGKTLYKNPYAWNKVANVLFLESPAGVGFSYSNTTSDYKNPGDKKTADDNYVFLVNWLERFPEYKTRDFFIAGESYAGHYVPQLAHTILQHKNANKSTINLKGILIGNAVINDETDTRGMYEYLWTHAIVSDEANYKMQKFCNFSSSDMDKNKECSAGDSEVYYDTYFLDIYNIYAPLCFSTNVTAKPKKASIKRFDPCSDTYIYFYLNRPDVQKALHANVTKLDHDWEPCSLLFNTWNDSPETMLPILKELIANGLRVWVISGDIDGRVPVTSTRSSLDLLKLPVNTSWYPWFVNETNDEFAIGGYSVIYKGGLTFATVRGAGHEVPSYQPLRALSLIQHFLDGTPLSDTT